jgi:hypothetical protein
MVSCTPEKNKLPKSLQKKIFDSIIMAKTNEIMKEASEDFDKRRAIEVKPLVDSFLKQKILQKDTLIQKDTLTQ